MVKYSKFTPDSNKDVDGKDVDEVTEPVMSIQQVQYAWVWSSIPWLLIIAFIYYTDILIEGLPILGAVVSIVILIPRFASWKKTRYIFYSDKFIYNRGGLFGSQQYTIPLDKLTDIQDNHGFLGRALGFKTVNLILDNETNQRPVGLKYISAHLDVVGKIKPLIQNARDLIIEDNDLEDDDNDSEN